MREELGMERENAGMVERWWSCPRCIHRQTTVEEEGGRDRPEGSEACASM